MINNSPAQLRVNVRFAASGTCRQWDPRLGEVRERGSCRAGEGLTVDLKPYAGQFFTLNRRG